MASKRKFENIKLEILKCFENSQHSSSVEKCGRDFIKIFDKFYDTSFREEFRSYLISIIRGIVLLDTKSFYTRRLLSFSAKTINRIYLYISVNEDDESLQTEADYEIEHYIKALLKMTIYETVDARLNSIYLLSKLIALFQNIELRYFTGILNRFSMLSVIDRDMAVRAKSLQAISSMAFRIPYDKDIFEEPFYGAIRVLENDPDKNVRIYALKSLPFNDHTNKLFHIASMDECPLVRQKVIQGLSCHLTKLTNIQPKILYHLLKNLFHETDQINRKKFFENLILSLIKTCHDDIVVFASFINVHEDKEFFERMFYAFFDYLRKDSTNLDSSNEFLILINKFIDEYLDDKTKLTNKEQNISSGLTFIWFVLSSYCRNFDLTRSINSDNHENTLDSSVSDTYPEVLDVADDILPLLDDLCPFVIKTVKSIVQRGNIKNQELTLHYLIRLHGLYSFNLAFYKTLVSDTFQVLLTNESIKKYYKISYFEKIFSVLIQINDNLDDGFKQFKSLSELCCLRLKNNIEYDEPVSENDVKILRLQLFEAFLKCLIPNDNKSSPKNIKELEEYLKENIIDGLESDCDDIVILSINCLCGYCLLSEEFVSKYSHHFFRFLRSKEISQQQIYAFEAICDFILMFDYDKIHLKTKESNDFEVQFHDVDRSKELIIKYLRKYFHSPIDRCDGNDETEYSLDYHLFTVSTKAICKFAMMKRFWSKEFFSKLIIMYLSNENIGDSLREYVQVFFSEFIKVFNNSEEEFKHGSISPYVDCYAMVIEKLFETQSGKNLQNSIEKAETFFLSMCEKFYNQLALSASQMILEPSSSGSLHEKMQTFNVNLLMTMDFTTLQMESLTVLLETSFSQNVSIYQNRNSKRIKNKTDPVVDALRRLNRKVEFWIDNFDKIHKDHNFIELEESFLNKSFDTVNDHQEMDIKRQRRTSFRSDSSRRSAFSND